MCLLCYILILWELVAYLYNNTVQPSLSPTPLICTCNRPIRVSYTKHSWIKVCTEFAHFPYQSKESDCWLWLHTAYRSKIQVKRCPLSATLNILYEKVCETWYWKYFRPGSMQEGFNPNKIIWMNSDQEGGKISVKCLQVGITNS